MTKKFADLRRAWKEGDGVFEEGLIPRRTLHCVPYIMENTMCLELFQVTKKGA